MEDIWQNHGTGQNPCSLPPRENSLHLWAHPLQNVCSWPGFKCIFGIFKIPVIFIYPNVSRGLSDLAIQISQCCCLFLLLLQLIFFFLNDLRQPTGCIFNFLCKAFCFFTKSCISQCLQQLRVLIVLRNNVLFCNNRGLDSQKQPTRGARWQRIHKWLRKNLSVFWEVALTNIAHISLLDCSVLSATSSKRFQISSHRGK